MSALFLTLPAYWTTHPILLAVLAVSAIAAVLGAIIVLVFHFFSVETDPRAEEIAERLPGANCGGCGYSGCSAYAEALAAGSTTDTGRCTAGGQETATALAEYLGQAPAVFIPKMALVHCQGSQNHVTLRYEYDGSVNCKTATGLAGGPSSCTHGCLGFGDCERVCEYGAIHVENGVAVVDPEKCIACGACVRACPRKLIAIEPKYTDLHVVRCSNPDPGIRVRTVCDTGCIGCRLCAKNCPAEAIQINGNLAQIDQDRCTRCGTCVRVCPTHAITAEIG